MRDHPFAHEFSAPDGHFYPRHSKLRAAAFENAMVYLERPKARIYELEKRRVAEELSPTEEEELQELRWRHPRIAEVVSQRSRCTARRYGELWHSRIPVVWLKGLKTGAWEGKLFQACILVIFDALPVAGTIRCMYEAESGDICEQDTKNFYKGSETTLLWPPAAKRGNQMRLRKAGAGDDPCSAGIQIFPRSWTPLTFYGFPVAAGGMAAFAAAAIFLRRPRNPVHSPEDKASASPKSDRET